MCSQRRAFLEGAPCFEVAAATKPRPEFHGYVIVIDLHDPPVVAALLALQRPRVVPEIAPAPIGVNMLARLADGLPPVAAVPEAIVIIPLMEPTALATKPAHAGRVFFEKKPRHFLSTKIRREYSDRAEKLYCHQF